MESKIILYHSDEESRCEEFVDEEDTLLCSKNSKDDIWLGDGMYFWDNIGNVKWWKRKQCDKHLDKKYCIVAANAVLNNLLDLTDYDVYTNLDKLWKQMCELCNLDSDVELGSKLNFLFEALDFSQQYDLVKVYGKYNRTPNKGFFKFDYNTMRAEPTIGVKCIYNIKSAKCIVEKELVREDES